jgi:hypothetical protein
MSDFLNREKAGFIAYAVRVTQIVVKHATAMEVFNRGKKTTKIGVPLTFSSIGISSLANELINKLKTYPTK